MLTRIDRRRQGERGLALPFQSKFPRELDCNIPADDLFENLAANRFVEQHADAASSAVGTEKRDADGVSWRQADPMGFQLSNLRS